MCFSVKFGHSSQPGVSMEQGGVRAGSKTRNSNRFCHHDYPYLVMFILILKRVGSRSLRRRRTLSARSETEQRPQSQYCPKPWKDHRIIVDYCHCLLQHLLHHCHHCHLFNIFFIVQSSSLVLFNLLPDPRSIFWIVSHHQSKLY